MLMLRALSFLLAVGDVTHATAPAPVHVGPAARVDLTVFTKLALVPSFSRQTKLACTACHSGFPQLNSFGRLFKLNGYTMTGLPAITSQRDSASRMELSLSPIAPISMMAIVATTQVAKTVPGTLNGTAQFPQQLSLFAASALSPRMGIFSQLTYTDRDAKISIDNIDLRYANRTEMAGKSVIYGLTLHNNPTVQDVWNTTPAWSYPFSASSVAPSPAAATLIEGGLAQSVLGLGAYTMFNNLIYAELTGYVSAPQGAALPADSTATNTPKSISPYWRVAVQHDFNSTYLMVGGFGLSTDMLPSGITGPTNRYRDLGIDAQLERKVGDGMLIGRASYIRENQTLSAFYGATPAAAQNIKNTISTQKVNFTYAPSNTHAFTVGYFGINGSSDNLAYPSENIIGSSVSAPTSQGATFEVTANPWLNVRLGAQYVAYQKFNGSSTSYDVRPDGRNAKDNNTLYLYLWLAY